MSKFIELTLDSLKPADTNPRFNLREIDELAQSIKEVGILQPLIVRKSGSSYAVIAGHRRLAAAERAGMAKVPCVVRSSAAKDDQVAHLVENTSRDDLLPAEIGVSVFEALKDKKITQAKLAKTLGKSATWVSKMKTIGEAAVKTCTYQYDAEDGTEVEAMQIEGTVFAKERDSEKLYNKARALLGLNEDDDGEDEQGEHDGGDQGNAPELQVLAELRAIAEASFTGINLLPAGTKLDVVPVGKAGYELRLTFKSEAKFRQAFAVETQKALTLE